MKEVNLNSIISRSLNENSKETKNWNCKIPDGIGGVSRQNPFDGFGILHGLPLYYESKLVKTDLCAFSFSKIEDHQYDNLETIDTILDVPHRCLFFVGYYVPRKLKIVFFIDSKFVIEEHKKGVKSFSKKILTDWYSKQLFLNINYKTDEAGKRYEVIENLNTVESKIIYGY